MNEISTECIIESVVLLTPSICGLKSFDKSKDDAVMSQLDVVLVASGSIETSSLVCASTMAV